MSQSPPVSPGYGFVGVGEISAAIVEGISTAAEPPDLYLSPRGHAVGRELASRFANVHVCESSQDVLDRATSIVLAVPRPAAEAVLTELSFRPDHVVMSAVAGLRLHDIQEWTGHVGHIVRTIPLPQAAHRQSLTTIYPDNAAARDVFGLVGGVLVPGEEETLDVFSAATATFAAHLDYLSTIAAWLTEHDVDRDTATTFITHIFGQLGQSLSLQDDALATMTGKHTTPGGINEQVRNDLRHDGVPEAVRHALERVLARLRG